MASGLGFVEAFADRSPSKLRKGNGEKGSQQKFKRSPLANAQQVMPNKKYRQPAT